MRNILALLLLISSNILFSQINKFGFEKVLNEKSDELCPFAILNDSENTVNFIKSSNLLYKRHTKEYIYVTATPKQIVELYQTNKIKDFYFSFTKALTMNDSTRVNHHVNEVNQGTGGLDSPYKGNNIIVGYIDTGCDYLHPDFKDANGNTRIIKYWDHNLPFDATRTPMPYGYGQVFDSIDLNNSLMPADCSSGHGTTVAGAGSGNGLANGMNAGMAPESKMIIVDFNFGINNFQLAVADACEYIFNIADQYGMPAVINISLGGYFGSHDGNDPASVMMEDLLDEKPGRIIVSSAGNGGNFKNFHIHNNVSASESFFWMPSNPSGEFGLNSAFVDIWGTVGEIENINFSFSAIDPNNNFSERGTTATYNFASILSGTISESIRNSNGDTIAKIDIYSGIQNGAYNLFAHVYKFDSTTYYVSMNTSGNGVFDAWTGANFNSNYQFIENIPSPAVYPPIVNYVLPDSLQSLVSDWNCSEKVISVANIQNRTEFIGLDSTVYDLVALNGVFPSGKLAASSSIGPTRLNVQKPEIAANGENSVSPGPTCNLFPPNSTVFFGGYHMMNGGTSMASPVIAGIAALYLEKCPKSTYSHFSNDLIETAFTDEYTGTTPNFGSGYGKAHALNLLLATDYNLSISGLDYSCGNPINLTSTTNEAIEFYEWTGNFTTNSITTNTSGTYVLTTTNFQGCKETASKTITIENIVTPSISITAISNSVCVGEQVDFTATTVNEGNSPILQWFVNGIPVGSNQTTFSSNTFVDGQNVTCQLISSETCLSTNNINSNPITLTVNPILNPTIFINSSNTTICAGETVNLTANVSQQGLNPMFQWYLSGVPAGQNGPFFSTNSILDGQIVTCELNVLDNCAVNNTVLSNSIPFVVNPSLNPSISITASDNQICPQESVVFTANAQNSGNNPSYQWYLNNGYVGTNATTLNLNQLNNGDFVYCMLNVNSNCATNNSVFSNFSVVQVSSSATNTLNNGTLSTTTLGESYQWYNCFTDELIIGASNPSFSPFISGSYYVIVNSGVCELISPCLNVQSSSIDEVNGEKNDITIFPNPTNSNVHVEFLNSTYSEYKLVSLTGQLLQNEQILKSQIEIDLSSYAKGVYFIQIVDDNKNQKLFKIVKN